MEKGNVSNLIPQRFVGLHAHSGASSYDGLGPASDHFKFCVENGLDAHAITEHGHMNSFSQAFLFIEKWKKEKKLFKYIPGVEAYVHPDLSQWRRDKEEADNAKASQKEAKKLAKKLKEGVVTNIDRKVDGDDETVDIETSNALTIENEEETKSGKSFNPVNRRHHLVVLPKTSAALQKVFGLVSKGYLEGFYRFPRIDLKMIKEAARDGDILLSTACLGGIMSFATLSKLRFVEFDKMDSTLLDDPSVMDSIVSEIANTFDMYSDAVGRNNVMLELQFNRLPAQDVVNRALLEFARRNSLTDQLIVTADSHYPRPDLWKHREMYKKLGYLSFTDYGPESLPKDRSVLKAELYPKNAQQVWDEYIEAKARSSFYGKDSTDELVRDAVERTHDIAHSVIGDVSLDKSYKYPMSIVPKDVSPFQQLCKQCKQGIIDRGLSEKPEYVARLKHELEVIKKMDNAAYFVTLARALELARNVCLLGIARGSSGGSLVAYVLGITDLDPIKYGCRFDRFLNVHRQGAPDIDVDIADRDAVLEVLRREFGNNNVIPISNVNTLKVKTLIKDLSKFHGISFDEANVATRTVEQEVRKATFKHGDDKNLFVLTYEDAMKHSPSFKSFIDKHPEVSESITILFKEQRSLGRHAGGVVIMDDAPNMMPLITSGGEPQTPWIEGVSGKYLEPLGYIKYDLLGLETMRLVQRTIELILIKQGNKSPTFKDVKCWYEQNLHPDVNDYNDQRVYENVYHEGRFPGIFQCTSTGAQKLFMKAKPCSIVDIAVLTSIYRPGPLAANVDKIYLDAKAGKKFDWGHPLFESVLGETYNCLIFQESVMDLAEHIAGFPKDQCDNVRRAIMKRDLSKGDSAIAEAKKMEDEFVAGATKKGIIETTARKAYQNILWFAGYGFNRAHAVAYAIDSYLCAWLLTHHEEEWLTAYLEANTKTPEARAAAFGEIRRLGYKIVSIDINHAGDGWTCLPGKKFMPSFLSCKGVGAAAVEEIMANRPYHTVEELIWEADKSTPRHTKFNKKALESLVKIGAFDSMKIVGPDAMFSSYNHMHEVIVENLDQLKKTSKREPHQGLKNLYAIAKEFRESIQEWTPKEWAENYMEVFGALDITRMVSGEVIARLTAKGVKTLDEYEEPDIYWFVIQEAALKATRANNKTYAVVNAVGAAGVPFKMNVWGWKAENGLPEICALYLAEVSKNDFGFSTSSWKLKKVG